MLALSLTENSNTTQSLTVYRSRNVLIQGLTSLNSAGIHVTVQSSTGVAIVDTAVSAPGDSPNTDGIHIKQSSDVTVRNARIGTGDDCISMVEGSSDVWIQGISCGPGHGIRLVSSSNFVRRLSLVYYNNLLYLSVSIGSLGDTPEQLAVRNITVRAVTLAGTTNGLRIKTWANANSGIVDGVAFSDVVMRDVRNPIIVDQNYCPGNVSCPTEVLLPTRPVRLNSRGMLADTVCVCVCLVSGIGDQDYQCLIHGRRRDVGDAGGRAVRLQPEPAVLRNHHA
jgi:polygalacturonase